MKKSLQYIVALLKDTQRVRKLTFIESCIYLEAAKGLTQNDNTKTKYKSKK